MDEVDPDHVRGDEDDEGDEEDEEEEEIQMKVYTASALLANTEKSVEARKSGKALSAPAAASASASSSAGKKPSRVWEPNGEYTLFRSGVPLLMDPDACISALQERTLTLFKHVDPNVKFAQDTKRPMWKGVFTMGPGMGYDEGQFYDPKQTHLSQIYATEWPKKNKPADNMRERRDGGKTPYWIDAWQIMKNNEESHKRKSRKKRERDMSIAQQQSVQQDVDPDDVPAVAAPSTSTAGGGKGKGKRSRKKATDGVAAADEDEQEQRAPIVESVDNFIFPVSGWMKEHIGKKETALPTVVANSMLRTSPASALVKKMPLFFSQLAKGHSTVLDAKARQVQSTQTAMARPPTPVAPTAATVAPKQPVKKVAAVVVVAAPPQRKPAPVAPIAIVDVPVEEEEEEEEKGTAPLPRLAVAQQPPQKKRERPEEVEQQQPPPPQQDNDSPLLFCPPIVREVLHTFAANRLQNAGAESAGGSFCSAWFECQPTNIDPDDFYRVGAPGDCIPDLAREIATRIMSRMAFHSNAKRAKQ